MPSHISPLSRNHLLELQQLLNELFRSNSTSLSHPGEFIDIINEPLCHQWSLSDKSLYLIWVSHAPISCSECGSCGLWSVCPDEEYKCCACGTTAGNSATKNVVDDFFNSDDSDSETECVGTRERLNEDRNASAKSFNSRKEKSLRLVSKNFIMDSRNNKPTDESQTDTSKIQSTELNNNTLLTGLVDDKEGLEFGNTIFFYSFLIQWIFQIPLSEDFLRKHPLPTGRKLAMILRIAYDLYQLFSIPGISSFSVQKNSNSVICACSLFFSFLLHEWVIPFPLFQLGQGSKKLFSTATDYKQRIHRRVTFEGQEVLWDDIIMYGKLIGISVVHEANFFSSPAIAMQYMDNVTLLAAPFSIPNILWRFDHLSHREDYVMNMRHTKKDMTSSHFQSNSRIASRNISPDHIAMIVILELANQFDACQINNNMIELKSIDASSEDNRRFDRGLNNDSNIRDSCSVEQWKDKKHGIDSHSTPIINSSEGVASGDVFIPHSVLSMHQDCIQKWFCDFGWYPYYDYSTKVYASPSFETDIDAQNHSTSSRSKKILKSLEEMNSSDLTTPESIFSGILCCYLPTSPTANVLLQIFSYTMSIPPLELLEMVSNSKLYSGQTRFYELLAEQALKGCFSAVSLYRRISPLNSSWMVIHRAFHSMDKFVLCSLLQSIRLSNVSRQRELITCRFIQRLLQKYGSSATYQFNYCLRVDDPTEKHMNGIYFCSSYSDSVAIFTCLRSARKTIVYRKDSTMITLSFLGSKEREVLSLRALFIGPVTACIETNAAKFLIDTVRFDMYVEEWTIAAHLLELCGSLRRQMRSPMSKSRIDVIYQVFKEIQMSSFLLTSSKMLFSDVTDLLLNAQPIITDELIVQQLSVFFALPSASMIFTMKNEQVYHIYLLLVLWLEKNTSISNINLNESELYSKLSTEGLAKLSRLQRVPNLTNNNDFLRLIVKPCERVIVFRRSVVFLDDDEWCRKKLYELIHMYDSKEDSYGNTLRICQLHKNPSSLRSAPRYAETEGNHEECKSRNLGGGFLRQGKGRNSLSS